MNRNYSLNVVKEEANEFLARKKAINNTTYLNYRTSINYFIYYLENIAEVKELNPTNKEKVLEGFQASLLEGFNYEVPNNEAEVKVKLVKVKASGVNTHIRRIKTFLNRCLGLTVEINKLNTAKPKYKSLPKHEIELLIAECSNYFKSEETAIRTSTLIKFLFNTAFRINEALTLEVANVYNDGSNYYVKIHEKGKAEGVLTEIAISENTYNMLMDYINFKAVPSDYVFSTKRNRPLARQNFNKNIIGLAKYTDNKYGTAIYKTVENNSSHVFRHSKATYLLNVVKEDVVTVKEILRHSSIDSTLIYLNPQEEAINKVRISNDI